MEKMRYMLKKRGADGIQGLARNFRICDTNGSGQLDEEELAKVSGSLFGRQTKIRRICLHPPAVPPRVDCNLPTSL